MATSKFIRWDRALKQCMESKKGDPKSKEKPTNRWKSDPMLLNQEAHELPPEKQREALDMMEEAPADLAAKLAPIWKYCFVQWHIYDAGREAIDNGKPLSSAFEDESLRSDIDALKALSDSGDLDKAATTEKWCWKLLEPMPEAGTIHPWNDDVAAQLLKVGKEERKEGVVAFSDERYDKAFWHFWQGLKLIARGPALTGGPLAKLRGDLYKNKSAAALKLKLFRCALRAANAALAIDPRDEKAWFRKACALEAIGLEDEARVAIAKAGLVPPPARTEQPAAPPVRRSSPSPPPRPKPANLIAEEELSPGLHAVLESLVFIEVGVDSLAAVDLVMHIQAELPETPIPLTLVFDCPRVAEAVAFLLGRINGEDDQFLRRKMNGTVWRAMCKALRRDPLRSWSGRSAQGLWPQYSEAEALEILGQLRKAYETQEWVQTTADIAKRSFFEQRSFLLNVRRHAFTLQRPILQANGYTVDADGLRKLECALVAAAAKSSDVRESLRATRIAMQGGPNGIWSVNMEPGDVHPWTDVDAFESRSRYMKADPFGPERVNTNSVFAA